MIKNTKRLNEAVNDGIEDVRQQAEINVNYDIIMEVQTVDRGHGFYDVRSMISCNGEKSNLRVIQTGVPEAEVETVSNEAIAWFNSHAGSTLAEFREALVAQYPRLIKDYKAPDQVAIV